jgi:hypothetical protein
MEKLYSAGVAENEKPFSAEKPEDGFFCYVSGNVVKNTSRIKKVLCNWCVIGNACKIAIRH